MYVKCFGACASLFVWLPSSPPPSLSAFLFTSHFNFTHVLLRSAVSSYSFHWGQCFWSVWNFFLTYLYIKTIFKSIFLFFSHCTNDCVLVNFGRNRIVKWFIILRPFTNVRSALQIIRPAVAADYAMCPKVVARSIFIYFSKANKQQSWCGNQADNPNRNRAIYEDSRVEVVHFK